MQTAGQCEHVWRVTSSPVRGNSRIRYGRCLLCGKTRKQSIPIEHAPKTTPVGRKITILGVTYRLIVCSLKRYRAGGYTYSGFCDPPTAKRRKILIEQTLDDLERLEILIHEMIHAGDWHKDEDSFVAPLAKDIAKVLHDDGYRRQDGNA